ncbi:ArsR/SmtB family transcription factor [Halosimplex salinum]|uniref:ArsR/SmtB family transcription factor n=1 Tax=Halosimplex salinum TaxID=1710538 RepID=UPI000F4AF30C|nr:metalloregulator ArsR/SmtB family transcription factor [Halosimplex salinum]
MATDATRLRRLLSEQLDECCEADVTDRIDELQGLAGEVPADSESDLTALSALSDETRHAIVRYLAAAPDELCVCELSPLLDVSDSAVSHALSDLHDAGLVTRRKDGTWRYYDATDRAERLLAALDETREGR